MERKIEELGDLEKRLSQDGLDSKSSPTERLLHLWKLYLGTVGSLNAARLEMKALHETNDKENMKKQNMLDEIRALTAQQRSIVNKLVEENQQLHAQLKQLHLEKEGQKMEVAELLHQGGLGEIVPSSPGEQVAYLLAEKDSLIERLQALELLAVEKCPASPGCPPHTDPEPVAVFKDGMDKLSFHKAVPFRGQSSWKKLLGLRKAAQSKQKLAVSSGVEPSEDGSVERLHLERDLDEASCRLSMAHKEIRRLTDELESAHMTQRACEPELQSAQQEVEFLRQEVEKLTDMPELRKAKELNECQDKEIKMLRDTVRSMDNERMALLAMLDSKMMEVSDNEDEEYPLISLPKVEKAEIAIQTVADDVESSHVRCLEDLNEKDLELRKLQACIQQLQQECDQMQMQKDQAQQLLEEQEQNHTTTVEAFKEELEFLETMVKQADCQQQESQNTVKDDCMAIAKTQECLLQQKTEECTQISEILKHTDGEVLLGREKIIELEKLNAEWDHKNKQVLAKMQEALARVSKLEKKHEAKTTEYQQALARESELKKNQESWAAELKEAFARVSELKRDCEAQGVEYQQALTRESELKKNQESWAAELKEALARVSELKQDCEAQGVDYQQALARESELKKNQESWAAELKKALARVSELERDREALAKAQECLLQQKTEECAQISEILEHAEGEVLLGREKTIELEKLNAEFDHKNTLVLAKMQEALARVSKLEQSNEAKTTEYQQALARESELKKNQESWAAELKEALARVSELKQDCEAQGVEYQQALTRESELKKNQESWAAELKEALARVSELERDREAIAKAQECLLQQKTEECAQISEILEHAEGEVLLGREKTIELEKLNAELDHKNTQVLAELQEALARVSKLEQSREAQTAEYQQALARESELKKNQESWAAELKEALARVSELKRDCEAQGVEYQQALTRESELKKNQERDLDAASCRLSMAHKEIRMRMTDELESAHMTQRACEPDLHSSQQEVEFLRREVEKLTDMPELRKAKELNECQDKEIKMLRDTVRSMDNERMALLAMLDCKMMEVSDNEDEEYPLISLPKVEKAEIAIQTVADDVDSSHVRCLEDLNEKDLELPKLQACIQQLQQECDQMQMQKDQAKGLLEEQELNHTTTVEALKKELEFLETMVKQADCQLQESQNTVKDDCMAIAKAQECLLQQKTEECAQISEILEHAEGEVLLGREKTIELEKLNAEWDHTNTQVLAKMQEALARVSKLEQSHEAQTTEYQQALARESELKKNQESWAAELKEALARVSELERDCEAQGVEYQQALARESELKKNQESWAAELKEALIRVAELEQSRELQRLLEKSRELQDHLEKEQNLPRQTEQMQELQKQLQQTLCEDFKKQGKVMVSDVVSNLQAEMEKYFQQRKMLLQREEMLLQEVGSLRNQTEQKDRQPAQAEVCAKLQEAQERETQLGLMLQCVRESLSATQREVLDLQKELRNTTLQLDLERAETERLKKDAKYMADDLARLRAQAEEAEKQRRLWLCREDVMQQQVKTLQDKQASLSQSEQKLQDQTLDLKAQLAALQKAEQAVKQDLQTSSLDMKNQLLTSQNAVLALQEELKNTLHALDNQKSKYTERTCNYKDRLSRAKQFHIKEVVLRDDQIKDLQRQCDFLNKKVDKVTGLTKSMDEINTNLLKENGQFQCQLLDEQEAQCKTLDILRTYKLRIENLEKVIEKMEFFIQDQILFSPSQVTRRPSMHLVSGKTPSATDYSALPKGYTMSDPFHIIQKARTAMKSEDVSPALSLTRTHTSEMGYLNLTPPLSPPGSQLQDDWTATSSADEAPQIENKERCLTERFL